MSITVKRITPPGEVSVETYSYHFEGRMDPKDGVLLGARQRLQQAGFPELVQDLDDWIRAQQPAEPQGLVK